MRESDLDLDAAIEFVVGRIAEEARSSGAPLTERERHFLHHLPRYPTNPTVGWGRSRGILTISTFRDLSFERLCTLARNAHQNDLGTRPDAAKQWKFAAAVLQLNNHPMAWLLGWAGMRTRPRWDWFLLAVTATLIVVACFLVILATSLALGGQKGLSLSALVIVCGVGLIAAVIVSYMAMRRVEGWIGTREITRYRCNLKT